MLQTFPSPHEWSWPVGGNRDELNSGICFLLWLFTPPSLPPSLSFPPSLPHLWTAVGCSRSRWRSWFEELRFCRKSESWGWNASLMTEGANLLTKIRVCVLSFSSVEADEHWLPVRSFSRHKHLLLSLICFFFFYESQSCNEVMTSSCCLCFDVFSRSTLIFLKIMQLRLKPLLCATFCLSPLKLLLD